MTVDALKQIWPEWQIESKPLGKGSFGVVYKAVRRDHNVESYAAIKVISIPTDSSEIDSLRSEGLDLNATKTYLNSIVNDFVSEIQLMESLKGVQNIVSVEDYKVVEKVGEVGWDIYIRMELLTPFNTYICDKNLTENDVIKLGCDICTALEICNKRNVIHRDIKPENIFINDFGDFKLGDFGIARKMENMTSGLSQKGTFNYMAPEVANSSDYDARVDIYSLGIVMYRLLNGNRLPFLDAEKQLLNHNERRNAIDRRLRGERLPVPCSASSEMADIILRACDYDPNMRFASAVEMKQALMNAANGTYKISAANNPNNTVSVHKAPADCDKTTSVRKATTANNQMSGQIGTFGNAPKNNLTKIIVIVLIVALLIGAGIFVVPKLINIKDNDEISGATSTTQSETAEYSKFDRERIDSIISEAESLAADEDYESALKKIQTGLVTYPKSNALQEKSEEYAVALNAQNKEITLAKAATFAESGDYESAIALIKNAQEAQGDDIDYQNAYNTYSSVYRTEVISSADALATNNDYSGAFDVISTAMAVIGKDSELTPKATEYENLYVSEVIAQADMLIVTNDFSAAESILVEALNIFSDNQKLKTKQSTLKDLMNLYENEWEIENNNTFQNANKVLLNKKYYGVLQSDWHSSEQDWYVFSLDAPGRVSLIFNSEMQGSNASYWDVSVRAGNNPDRDLWQEYIHGYTTETQSVILALPAGIYYVEIESSDKYSSDIYSFEVVYEGNEGNWEIESNNTFQTANSILLNKTYSGVLQSDYQSFEQDWFAFYLETTSQVSLVFNSSMQSSDDNYWDVSIRSENNPDEDLWQEYIKGYTTKTQSLILTLSAGTYYIEIESANKHSSDPYSFEVIHYDS